MIPITIGFFAMQSDGRRSRRLALAAAYVAGLVVMYSSLGLVAALSGKMFGSWLQHPVVLIGFAILMLILASSMFGAWEMNWLAFNYAADVKLPDSAGDPLAFFMYPQAETAEGRRDSLDPDAFRYTITARELAM